MAKLSTSVGIALLVAGLGACGQPAQSDTRALQVSLEVELPLLTRSVSALSLPAPTPASVVVEDPKTLIWVEDSPAGLSVRAANSHASCPCFHDPGLHTCDAWTDVSLDCSCGDPAQAAAGCFDHFTFTADSGQTFTSDDGHLGVYWDLEGWGPPGLLTIWGCGDPIEVRVEEKVYPAPTLGELVALDDQVFLMAHVDERLPNVDVT